MTEKDSYRFKARAVFLAAIMVLSMVAVGAGFAGSAAAANSATVDANPQTVSSTSTHTVVAEVESADDSASLNEIYVDYSVGSNPADVSNVEQSDVTVEYQSSDISSEIDDVSDSNNGERLDVSLDGSTTLSAGEDVTVTIENVENPSSATSSDVDVALNDQGTDNPATASVTYTSATAPADFGGDVDLTSGATYWQGQDLGIYVPEENLGGHDFSNVDELEIRRYDAGNDRIAGIRDTVTLDDDDRTAVIDTSNLADDEFVIVPADPTNRAITFQDGQVDSTGTSATAIEDAAFEIAVQDLSTEFGDDEVGNLGEAGDTTIEFDSIRGTYTMDVEAEGIDGEDLFEIFNSSADFPEYDSQATTQPRRAVQLDPEGDDEDVVRIHRVRDGEFDVSFDGIDADEYEFDFEVVDSTAEDSASITVTETGEGTINFPQTYEGAQGDIIPITVEATEATSSGYVTIGNIDDDGYQLNVTVDDFGDEDEITLYFNTYAAGNADASDVITLSEESDDNDAALGSIEEHDDVELEGEILDTGDYELASSVDSFEDAIESPESVGTLFVEERSTDSMTTWIASSSNANDLESVEDLTEAVENNEVTQSDTVARNDVMIHEVDATGLYGLFANSSSSYDHDEFDITTAFSESTSETVNEGVELTVEQTNPQSNRAPLELDFDESTNAISVVADRDGSFYVLLNPERATFKRGGTGDARTIPDEARFEAEFTVKDERLLDEDRDDYGSDREYQREVHQSVSATYEVQDRTGEFAQDPYNVSNAEGQVFEGTTNIAPGSETTIRIRATEDTQPRFIKTDSDVVVQAGGTFSTEFDFSDQNIGDTYNARFRSGGTTLDEVEGTVVEAADTPTPTEETDTPTPTEETDTPTPTEETDTPTPTETEETPEDTDETTPGFGAVVGLIALIAAALLAVRRRP